MSSHSEQTYFTPMNRIVYYSSLLLLALTLGNSNPLSAQSSATLGDTLIRDNLYRNTPVWKDMLDDTTANYFEVQKAFALFWEGKKLPEEEEDVIGEKGRLKNNLINRIFYGKELNEQLLRDTYAFDYKRYRRWLIKMEPYVQEDGRILYPFERLQLWKQHREELNNQ